MTVRLTILLTSSGIPPAEVKSPSDPTYTIPALKLNANTYIMDSAKIAPALEAAHPSPSLQLEHPIVDQVQALVYKCIRPLVPEIMPLVPKNVLSNGSVEYWVRTRSERYGDLDTFRREKGGQQCWDGAQAGLEETAALLKREAGGPFFLGAEACYADMVWVGFVQFVRRASEEGFEKLVGVDEVLRRQYEACGKWMEKDD